jgi:hypothetical protein
VKPNIIKLLIITNIGIFLISTGIIFLKITAPQTTTISSKKNVSSLEEKTPDITNNTNIAKEPPASEEKPTITQVTENVIQKPTQTITKKQKKVEPTQLPKTDLATNVGYMEKETPSVRNIKFVFFSRKAKKVSIIGDFNDWVPQSLVKVAENRWEITVKITAGQDYLYNFLVDGKVTIDPNNKKPPQISPQGFKSSVLSL